MRVIDSWGWQPIVWKPEWARWFSHDVIISPNSHIYSHGWEKLLSLLHRLLWELSPAAVREIFSGKIGADSLRFRMPLPTWVDMGNDLVSTTADSVIIFAKRAIGIINGKQAFRNGHSRMVLNASPQPATHLHVTLGRSPGRHGNVAYKLVTAFPGGERPAPPEPWDATRIEALNLKQETVDKFWRAHALCLDPSVPDIHEVIDIFDMIHTTTKSKLMVDRILESSGVL